MKAPHELYDKKGCYGIVVDQHGHYWHIQDGQLCSMDPEKGKRIMQVVRTGFINTQSASIKQCFKYQKSIIWFYTLMIARTVLEKIEIYLSRFSMKPSNAGSTGKNVSRRDSKKNLRS